MVGLLDGRIPGVHVEFVDATGAKHVVVLRHGLCARALAARKLARWRREGRAFYAEPLEFVQVIRRR